MTLKKRIETLEREHGSSSRRMFNLFGDVSDDEIRQATGTVPGTDDIVIQHVELGGENDLPLDQRCSVMDLVR